jgi:hypothetical protein
VEGRPCEQSSELGVPKNVGDSVTEEAAAFQKGL